METSSRLRRDADKILKLWESRAIKEIPAAVHLESLALRNSLPEYLELLADALSTTIDRTHARATADRMESQRVGRLHGSERASSRNYTIDQLISEYHLLRQVVCDVLEEEAPLIPVEREVIVTSIEQAVSDASTQFSEQLRDIQKSFTDALAHDLRGPITTAKSASQLILRHPEDVDHSIRFASRISSSMDRLDAMIHNLLDASRIRAGGRLPLDFATCDLDLIARQVVDEANFSNGNRLTMLSSGECLGYWSEGGLRRMIENLTTNAAKYGAEDKPVTVEVTQTQDTATLRVHNEGNPIAAGERDILFEQFRRARSAESKIGWGLGLTVVKGIAEAHDGTVDVESEPGKGTTFTVTLPKDFRKAKKPAA